LFIDTLTNLVAGLFTGKDKLAHDRFGLVCQDRSQLDAAYRSDWIARKIVDVPPFDMTREWRAWQAEDDQIEALEAEEKRLGLQGKLNRALRLSRLYGGSALVIGLGDADPAKPLPEVLAKGAIRYLHAMHRYEITAGEIDRDVMSPTFGEPKYYQVSSTGKGSVQIHPSRVVRFLGAELPDPQMQGMDGWGDSALQAVWDAVHHAGLTQQGIATLLHEAKVDVISVPNLAQALSSSEYAQRMVERFTMSNMLKSINNTLLLDEKEKWDRKQINFAQLPDVLDRYLQIAAGAADIPATRLLGQAPAGMNATGESDIRNYYDRIAAEQNVMLTPALARLDEALIMSALGARPPEVHYEWSPLWGLSETERADIGLKKAQATQIYAVNDLLAPEVLAKVVPNQLTEDGVYPGLEAAQADYEKGLLELPEYLEEAKAEEEAAAEAAAAAASAKPTPGQPVADAEPRTLYVRRDVVNVAEIRAWAKAQGVPDLVDNLHVTIAHSRTPLDWMKIDGDWNVDAKGEVTVAPGGVRIVEPLGNMTAVLLFTSSPLTWRHETIVRAGASWDYPDFQPHISLTKAPVDVSKIEPYRGRIVLGPEIFEPIKEDA
jgi:phage-related protein (TIGR01555 family)